MVQAYEEPMVFTKNQALNPILVLSLKIFLFSNWLMLKLKQTWPTINPTCFHPVVVEVYKTNFP